MAISNIKTGQLSNSLTPNWSTGRHNEFNEYRYKYYFGFPENSNYSVCKPRSSSIFMTPNKFYSYKTPSTGSNTVSGNNSCDNA